MTREMPLRAYGSIDLGRPRAVVTNRSGQTMFVVMALRSRLKFRRLKLRLLIVVGGGMCIYPTQKLILLKIRLLFNDLVDKVI